MSTTQHGSFLTQLTRLGAFSCYLLREEDGLTLIDTGLPGSAPSILAAAAALGQPIVRIVLTHAHLDHVGSLDALHVALPQAAVLISAREARLLAGDMTLDQQEPQAKLRGGFPKITTTPTQLLNEGDRIRSLEVVAAPGHTPGHIAFFDTRDRTLLAGDAFYTVGGVAVVSTMRWWFPFPALATWHAPTARATAQKLGDLAPARLAVGHGPVVDQPSAAISAAIGLAARSAQVADGTQ